MGTPGQAVEKMMLPLLRYVALYNPCQYDSAFSYIADRLNLSDEERTRRIPSTDGLAYQYHIRLAVGHLCKAGLLERIGNKQQKMVRITNEGQTVFAQQPQAIDYEYLMRFESYRAWQRGEGVTRRPRRSGTDSDEQDDYEDDVLGSQERLDDQTESEAPLDSVLPEGELHDSPDHSMEKSYVDINNALQKQLRERMRDMSPEAFERLVLKLMLKMGYGASSESGEHTGRRGDGGIDAIVNQDLLGLDRVGLQAKRYNNQPVSVGMIREFIGALGGYSKGVLATTSNFTKDARQTANGEQSKRIILLDGDNLARLLIEHDIAVRTYRTIELKKLDTEFFKDLETESRPS